MPISKISLAYLLSLGGYFALFFLLLFSIAQLPADYRPTRLLLLLILVGPLLFPLRGLLHGRPYTHAWSGFMALVYLVIGVAVAAGDGTRLLGISEATAATTWFTGSLLYVRWKMPKKNAKPAGRH